MARKPTWLDHRARLEAFAAGNRSDLRQAVRAALARIDRLENAVACARVGARVTEDVLRESVEARP